MSDCLYNKDITTLKGKILPLRCGKCPPCMKLRLANRKKQNLKYSRLKRFENESN